MPLSCPSFSSFMAIERFLLQMSTGLFYLHPLTFQQLTWIPQQSLKCDSMVRSRYGHLTLKSVALKCSRIGSSSSD